MSFLIDKLLLDELTTDPTTPVEGQAWYNTTDKRFKNYVNGSVHELAHVDDLEAGSILVNATGFSGILSVADTTVQLALSTIDQRIFTGAATPAPVVNGTLWYNTTAGWNCLMQYDSSRTKWLSVAEFTLGWGHDSPDGQLLAGYGITVPSAGTGIYVPRNCCVKRISARCTAGNTTKRYDIYVNGASVLNFSLATVGGNGVYKDNATNLNLAENDAVWIWAAAAGLASTDVTVLLWCSWRV
jgi:hypothetical protein